MWNSVRIAYRWPEDAEGAAGTSSGSKTLCIFSYDGAPVVNKLGPYLTQSPLGSGAVITIKPANKTTGWAGTYFES